MADEKKANGTHVLILPFPGQGHINPMLQFATRLVSKGVQATLVTTVFYSKSKSLPSHDHVTPVGFRTISDGFDEGGFSQAESHDIYLSTFKSVGSQSLASLIKEFGDSGDPIDAIVYDGFMQWALDVAKQFGIRAAVFLTQSGAVNSIHYHVSRGFLKLPVGGPEVSLPGMPELKVWELPSLVCHHGSHPAWYDVIVNQFSDIEEVDWVLVNTFYELEKEVADWMSKIWKLCTIGPTIPSMYLDRRLKNNKDYGLNLFNPNTSTCMTWLNTKPNGSVVYVSFGSLAELGAEQMAEVAWGLKETDAYFLWVVREPEEPKLPNDFKDMTREKGLVVGWCPQLEVLNHESVGCFMSHCGYNSVLEALGLGVPMVAMPQWADQPTNAKYVEEVWGIGIRALGDEEGIVRREIIKQCIDEVMKGGERGKEIKKNSIKWKNLAVKAADQGGSSDKNIDEFVAKLLPS
ncbi:UDP-glycosyltransferase 74 F1 [Hibiscus trionum]|nr:UDP-glycosyltransferase 74 F1 [Hibiscus trionum]